MKALAYPLEALALWLFFGFLRLLPLDSASGLGGFLGRTIGPMLSAHRIAQKNLAMIFPEWTESKRRAVIKAMWDNLGRTGAELAFLPTATLFERIDIEGAEHLPAPGQQVIFFSGHLGNWELSYVIARRMNIPLTLVYRAANNPYVDRMVAKIRASQSDDLLPKGTKGAVRLGRAIKGGFSLAMLVDQKMNDGIKVPFFGREAMTAPAIAEISLRYHMPLIPARVVRTQGAHFKGIIYPPIILEKTGDEEKDTLFIMTKLNALLESWIRENPEQWFWVHRRWPKSEV